MRTSARPRVSPFAPIGSHATTCARTSAYPCHRTASSPARAHARAVRAYDAALSTAPAVRVRVRVQFAPAISPSALHLRASKVCTCTCTCACAVRWPCACGLCPGPYTTAMYLHLHLHQHRKLLVPLEDTGSRPKSAPCHSSRNLPALTAKRKLTNSIWARPLSESRVGGVLHEDGLHCFT